ncbi:MAG: AAA family ATPase, partial [Alphaproteobacteria bacterium]|nr:AAA family ATPase [Alphaproteobacteria bacterium]
MAKSSSLFACQSCGASYPKWAGKCEACGSWNSLVEEAAASGPPKGLNDAKHRGKSKGVDFVPLKSEGDKHVPRRLSGINEFDRVLGGGMVPGSAILVGGDPGIGKSTLLLQTVCRLAQQHKVAYISGEEAIDQVRLRAARLGL